MTRAKTKSGSASPARSPRRPRLAFNQKAIDRLKLVVVAFSYVERDWFPNEGAYEAELEVVDRAAQVTAEVEKLGIPVKSYPADSYFLGKLMVDQPSLVLNLVDTVRGRDALGTAVPAALELADIPFTGAGMRGLVIGNDRNLFKELLDANDIPTPDFQFISRRGRKVDESLGLPLIVKLNESGGSVGIDNNAVKETLEDAQVQVDNLIATYHIPVIVEKFVDGPEITVVAFDDGRRVHILQAQKVFHLKPDGKHEFTSLESYDQQRAYSYTKVKDKELAEKIEEHARAAFRVLSNRDWAKFDVRVDLETGTPYFTDCNPNTAFGPDINLPFTEVLDLHGIPFQKILASLLSKHGNRLG